MPEAISARWSGLYSVTKRVCPKCCKSVWAHVVAVGAVQCKVVWALPCYKACVSKSVWAYVVAVGAVQCPGPLLPGGLRLRDGSHLGHTRIQGTVRCDKTKKGLMVDAM